MQKQLQFNFREMKKDQQEIFDSFQSYRINKYMDWYCDRVPYWIGHGIHNKYCDIRLWLKSKYQKIRYGVSNEECWSLDITIAKYVLPRLKHFRKMKRYGIPVGTFLKQHSTNEEEEKSASDEWNKILDEMIWTFEYILDEEKFNPAPILCAKTTEELMDQIANKKTPEQKAAWDNYMKKNEELNQRKKNGLELFSKHFSDLWD